MAEMEMSCRMPTAAADGCAEQQLGTACCCAISPCPDLPAAAAAVFVVENPLKEQGVYTSLGEPVRFPYFYTFLPASNLSLHRDCGPARPLFVLKSSYLI